MVFGEHLSAVPPGYAQKATTHPRPSDRIFLYGVHYTTSWFLCQVESHDFSAEKRRKSFTNSVFYRAKSKKRGAFGKKQPKERKKECAAPFQNLVFFVVPTKRPPGEAATESPQSDLLLGKLGESQMLFGHLYPKSYKKLHDTHVPFSAEHGGQGRSTKSFLRKFPPGTGLPGRHTLRERPSLCRIAFPR